MPDPQAVSAPLLQLDLTEPYRHLVRASLRFTPRPGRVAFRLPSWTPGSYLIRDYVRTLEGLEAWQGEQRLEIHGAAPQGWWLLPSSGEPVTLCYRILATELTVRTCHLNAEHGFLALAGVALRLEAERWSPHLLELCLPPGWQPFLPLPETEQGQWIASTYDQLIDTPVEVGPHPSHGFAVAGVPHQWVTWGEDLPASDSTWLADVTQVCLACCRLIGVSAPPASSYLFVLHLLAEGYGGLEHHNSCVLQYGRGTLARPAGRRKLLQLVAHEYLHQWNVRRLRPAELTPIDYDQPIVVPSLWFAEGITSYFDQLLPMAAGLCSEAELLEDLGADLSRYRLTPGRYVQSLRQSSQEAWVKLYRQDAYSADNQISYYLKGAVLALVLDLHLRREDACLALVMQDLWQSHGRWERGYQEADLVHAFASHASDLSTKLPQWLNSTDDPSVDDYLADVGLRLVPQHSRTRRPGWRVEPLAGGGLRLGRVERHGPAESAGLQVGDELLALDRQRLLKPEDLDLLLAAAVPGLPSHDLLFCRDAQVRQVVLQPDLPGIESWRLEIDPDAPPPTQQRRRRWLAVMP